MISANVNQQQINDIKKFLDGNAKAIRQQLYIATNKAAGKTKAMIAKELAKELPVPQKMIKKTIFLRKAKSGVQRKAFITQKDFKGLPLRNFKAKQVSGGVTVKTSKTSGTTTILGAFQGPKVGVMNTKWRGNAYKRDGKPRKPITMQRGPSAWEVFKKLSVEPKAVTFATTQLTKEVTERARFLGLKKSGAI